MCYFNSCPYLLIDSDKATKGLLCGPREGLPTPVFWPGKSMDYSPRGCKESDTTEWISLLLSCGPRSHIWESCKLENSTNYYEWTTFPKSFNMFFEIAPQFIHIVISRCRYYFWVSIRSSFFQQPNTCLNGTTHYFPPPQVYMHTQSLQSCPTLCNAMDYSLPGSSVHGILQARKLDRVAMPSSRGSSWPRDWIRISCIADRFFTAEPLGKPPAPLSGEFRYCRLKCYSLLFLFPVLTSPQNPYLRFCVEPFAKFHS